MVRKIPKAEMFSSPEMQIYTPPYFSPECRQLTSPYDNCTEPYNDNMPNASGQQYASSSPPESPPIYHSNTTQIFPTNNAQGQEHGQPAFQVPMHDQRWNTNDDFTPNTNTFDIMETFTSWPHYTVPATPTSATQYDFPNHQMEVIHINLNYDPSSYPTTSASDAMPSPFFAEPFPQGGAVISPANMSFLNHQTDSIASHSPSSPLSNMSSPTIVPYPMDYPNSPVTTKPNPSSNWRSSSVSSTSSVSTTQVTSPYARVRRRQKPKTGPRLFKCKKDGCCMDFDRQYNFREHDKTHDPNRQKAAKCPYRECRYSTEGFVRKHDLDRHLQTKAHLREKREGSNVFTCTICGTGLTRPDTLKRHIPTCQKKHGRVLAVQPSTTRTTARSEIEIQ